ncbi:MAG: hypothetical protein NTZ05_17745, partial [Chloroflexi bacterium]|nr:hypothetical protein [Chloroflexota bacterium]
RRTEVRRIMDAERSKRYREFDEKLGAARDSAARQVTETRNAEAAALVRQNPNLDRARLAELVEQTIAADVARLNGRYHEQLAAGHADIDQPIAEFQRKEFADIEQNLERKRSNINSQRYREFAKRTQRSRSEDDTLREECWAHHEELYTYTAIGGTDPDTLLDLVVFLNSDDCRKLLNIGK